MDILIWTLLAVVAVALVAAVMLEMRRRRLGDSVSESAPPKVVPEPEGPTNPVDRHVSASGGRA